MNSPADFDRDETGRLRAEWLQYRSRLNDPETGLPTLAGIVDDLRRQLEDGLPLGVFTLSLYAERQLEESWGWQAYDRLVVEFIRTLRLDRGNGIVPEGLICLPGVRADEVLLFLPLDSDRIAADTPVEWLGVRAERRDQ
ncbi:MAG TPA: hypothetical protein VFL12_02030, partial [Thermoanaerobaculia bacterium]|nr:hypothetical protein [Thermoanaerobaculia bacterium]